MKFQKKLALSYEKHLTLHTQNIKKQEMKSQLYHYKIDNYIARH